MKKFILGVILSSFLIACNNEKTESTGTTDAAATTTEAKTGDEILAMSEADGVKSSFDAFSKADIDGMTANYDENIRYYWSGGDSLIGKKAVHDYYTGRWKLIDSLEFVDHVLLPVKVNISQAPGHSPGKWVLHWGNVNVKYKNGKKISFWIHNDYHYNEAGKIDVAIQYIDRHLLLEATKGMQ